MGAVRGVRGIRGCDVINEILHAGLSPLGNDSLRTNLLNLCTATSTAPVELLTV